MLCICKVFIHQHISYSLNIRLLIREVLEAFKGCFGAIHCIYLPKVFTTCFQVYAKMLNIKESLHYTVLFCSVRWSEILSRASGSVALRGVSFIATDREFLTLLPCRNKTKNVLFVTWTLLYWTLTLEAVLGQPASLS